MSSNIRDIPVPNVQWKIRDDWQRSYPTHVEFLDKNKFGKITASVGFIKRKVVAKHGHMNIKKNLTTNVYQYGMENITTRQTPYGHKIFPNIIHVFINEIRGLTGSNS